MAQQHLCRGVGGALAPPLRPQKPFSHVMRETAPPRKNACKPTDFFCAPTPRAHPSLPLPPQLVSDADAIARDYYVVAEER